MGIHLSSLVEPTQITVEELKGKKVAVDAFNWIFQFITTIRGYDGEPLKDSKGRITSHLSGLFYRNINLIENGVKLIYVFDGEPPDFKRKEIERRKEVRENARKEWINAVEEGRTEDALKYAKRSATLDDEMLKSSRQLLEAMGIAVVQAPSEGEALASHIVRNNDAWCIGTQDFDALLFGATRTVRNLSISGKRKYGKTEYTNTEPQLLVLKDFLDKLELTHDQLITLGILVGTDYNQGGVKGYGPAKALKLVKEKKTFEKVMEGLDWQFDIPADDIFQFFKHPTIGDYKINFPEVDENKIRKILSDHEFSEDRINNGIKRLKGEVVKKTKKGAKPEVGKQSSLTKFSLK